MPAPSVRTAPIARLSGVSVRYPARATPVLDAIDCEIEAGRGVIVFGASGSGKSSILQLLSGVIPHSVNAVQSGRVEVDGRDVAESSVVELSRTVGVVAQDPESQLCLARVEDEIALGLENRGTPPEEIDRAIDAALDTVDAGALRMRDTATLSGGECQRLGVAAALVARPRLLLLDEPTSMLDADGVSAVRAALELATTSARAATVLVEHRLDEIAGEAGVSGLPERAVVLGRDGRVLAQGPTTAVLADNARALRAGGCWLPLDTELRAITGSGGGLHDPVNRAMLDSVIDRASGAAPDEGTSLGEVLLSAQDLEVGRPGLVPLLRLSLELHAGEITAVVGRNGVGKSTLLRTLAGVLRPAGGSLEGDGINGNRVGMIFQNPEHQFVANTVEAEIAVGLGEVPPERRGTELERLLSEYRLSALRGQNPWRLSGGEKRRLSIAAMLAHGRRVVLADEPSYGLDRRDALAAMGALRRAADAGAAVLIASHDARSIAGISDRLLVLDGDSARVLVPIDAAVGLRATRRLAAAGVRVPPLVSRLAERAASARQLQAMLHDFETMPEAEA